MRFFWPDLNYNPLIITGDTYKYLKDVLRARAGDDVTAFDGKGNIAFGKITALGKNHIEVEVFSSAAATPEPTLKITLLQAVLKGRKMDLVIQKTTELGVSAITPAFTRYTEVQETRRAARWRKIAEEASRQCGRVFVPEISAPVPYETFMSSHEGPGVLFWEEGGQSIKEVAVEEESPRSLTVAVGPEGGFTREEAGMARQRGFHIATLGPRTLRAETAAIAALTLVQFEFGDMG
jgi:16S rRNA (uracil1498-N3)-methyltransferase